MRHPFTRLYVHLVWSTWDRLPLVTDAIRRPLAGAMTAKCRELNAEVVGLGLMPDHVHLLVRIPTTLAVATLAKEVKGSSSHLVNHALLQDAYFKWQGAYGAFSVGAREVPVLKAYLANQERHHSNGSVRGDWEMPSGDEPPGDVSPGG